MVDCEAVREVSLASKLFFIRYRVSGILVGLTLVNILLQYMEKNVVTRFSAYKNYSAETNQMMGIRFLQLLFGMIVGFGGYGTLLFNAISGCDASELYLFYFGGVLLLFLDLHEYVRSWPLRAPILGHHVMVFFFGLAIIEYDLIPPPDDPDPRITVATMLLVANIGLMWITDFFHVVFRVSTSLPLIEKYRKIYLIASIIRPITLGLMIYSAAESFIGGSIAGGIPSLTLSLAYAYNLVKAIQFVYKFDCEKYFQSHQAKWVRECFKVDISSEDIRTKRISIKYNPSDVREELLQENQSEEGGIFANNRASLASSTGVRRSSGFKPGGVNQVETEKETGTSMRKRRSSAFESLLSIDVENDRFLVMEGLRGDAAVREEMDESKWC